MATEKQLRNQQMMRVIEADDLTAYQALTESLKSYLTEMTPFGTHLHIAAKAGSYRVVKYLVEQGIDINRRGGTSGGNALDYVASTNHVEMVKFLLKVGSEMDVSEPVRNPLFAAIYGGNEEIVRTLLEAGIDAKIRYTGESMKDMDAYAFAVERGQLKIAEMIKSYI